MVLITLLLSVINGGYEWEIDEERFSITRFFFVNLNTNSTRMFDLNLIANLYGDNNEISAGASYRIEHNHYGGQRLSLSPIVEVKLNYLSFRQLITLGCLEFRNTEGNGFYD